MDEKWKYVLHLEGIDYKTEMPEVDKFRYKRFNEYRYFNSLSEAFESLIKIDPSFFDVNVDTPDNSGVRYETATINPGADKEAILEIAKIPMHEVPDGSPTPGIYVHFAGIDMLDFQKNTGWDFSNFEDYDGEIPFLLLAKYSYANEYVLKNVEEYDRAVTDIKAMEDARYFNEGRWQYTLQVNEKHYWDDETKKVNHDCKADGPLLIDKIFHYEDVREAFADLLNLDLRRLHETVAFDSGLGMYIEKAFISDVLHENAISLVNDYTPNGPGSFTHDGLYLHFRDVNQFEHIADLHVSNFKNYRRDTNCLLLAEPGLTGDAMIATKEFFLLMHEVKSKGSTGKVVEPFIEKLSDNVPFVLKIHWDIVLPDSAKSAQLRVPYEEKFTSFEQAFRALGDLDDVLFEKDQSVNFRHPLYIKSASIFSSRDQQQIMSKFMVQENHDRLPNGVYVKLNQDALSIDVLKVTYKQLSEIEYAGSFHFLICKMKQPKLPESEMQERLRRNHRLGRRFFDGDNKGLTNIKF